MKGLALTFTSQIRWYKPSTPPRDGTKIIVIVQTQDRAIQLESIIYCTDTDKGILWVVYEGSNAGEQYKTPEILAWADGNEVAESARKSLTGTPPHK